MNHNAGSERRPLMDPIMGRVHRECQRLAGAERTFPFGEQVAVYKVGGKMFALVSEDGPPDTITLKGDPADNEALRAEHSFIRPGYYMNKQHWITVDLDPDIPLDLVAELIAESHRLVASKLTRRLRAELGIDLPT